ncbi:hypothetical protein [Lentzea sp. NPDC051838]|uniref:hypothetical protein n=1 Tax=Lentzea sp. NPDC051838 TaxID=3154849 RepID=UPI00343097D6
MQTTVVKIASVGGSFLALLLLLALANLGFRFTLKECVETSTRRLKEKGRARSLEQYRKDNAGRLAGLLLAAFGYGLTARIIAGSIAIQPWPAGSDSTNWYIPVYLVTAALYLDKVLSLNRDYRAYRESTNFRLWFRSARTEAPRVADLYFYAGWIRRHMEQSCAGAQATIVALLVLRFILSANKYPSGDPRMFAALPLTIASIVAVIVLKRLVLTAWTALRPDLELAAIATVPFPEERWRKPKAGSAIAYVRPGNWRTPSHFASFRAAECVELCVRAVKNRLASDQGEKVELAARKIAEALRLRSLHVEESLENKKLFCEQLFYSLRLVTGSDPVAAVEPIRMLTLSHPHPPPPLAPRRALRAIEVIVGAINVHWPPLKVILIVAAIIVILLAGKQTDILTLLK